ncbi:hypothetical protein F3Y22_tig00018833pilonHSYRG00032 [Hibiscus syriacus]|uniref:Uncharacterized protein n=1 Tax=Hibiscus syriacus TaxID=106335 RepID=A0A6A3C0C3_HIBSY|nr:hypothetical protein F3Y22_tig00018833pilonHSYRG00032 [Hibiscus syriacus]
MTVETSPDWLPPGWTREFRFQKTGRRITTLIHQLDLDCIPSQRCIRDWLVEVKTRKSGLTSGRRVEVYVDPSMDLNSIPSRCYDFLALKYRVVIDKSTDDDLPSRWIKEVKSRRNVYGVRRYPQLPAAKRKKVKVKTSYRRVELAIGGETSDRSILPDLDTETFEKGQVMMITMKMKRKRRAAWTLRFRANLRIRKSSICLKDDKSHLRLNVHSNPEVAAKQAYASTMKSLWLTEMIIKPIEDADISESSDKVGELLKVGLPHKDAADEGLVSTPASSVLQEKNLRKTRMESKRSNVETKNSSKFKKLKKLDMTCRFSTHLLSLSKSRLSMKYNIFLPIHARRVQSIRGSYQ